MPFIFKTEKKKLKKSWNKGNFAFVTEAFNLEISDQKKSELFIDPPVDIASSCMPPKRMIH